MQARGEAALALGTLAILAVGVLLATPRRPATDDVFEPRSSYLTGPSGARALADALGGLGVAVHRLRRPMRQLNAVVPVPGDSASSLQLVVLDPALPLNSLDAVELVTWVRRGGHLVLAGVTSAPAMRCFGFEPSSRRDSTSVVAPGRSAGPRAPHVRVVLATTGERVVVDSTDAASLLPVRCRVPPPVGRDTLLLTVGGRLEAVRLRYREGGTVTLVADGRLFSNRSLRDGDAGARLLGWLAQPSPSVYFDEYHQGYGTGGSLAGETLAWSARSPWGWGVWQLALVGVLALLAAGVRFGPVVPAIERRRRSPLEHVRALATALAAARGHDVAVRLMVQGLRRRLSRDNRPRRQPVEEWLRGLTARIRTTRAREAVALLQGSIIPPQSADAVLKAAYAVEDVWQELKP